MKKVLCFLILMFLFVGSVKAEEVEIASKAKSAILLEATTGNVLYEKNSHEKLAPASMTKIMSMLLIVESIEDGVIGWDDMITVSEHASSMGGSQILLETGEQMSVSDLFKGVAVASGNDAVVALAEAIAGTEEAFVQMMNERVKELGLKDTMFKNPHGLDDANHYSSSYDMAMIAKELVKHEKVLEFTSIYEDYLRKGTEREFWLVNTNKLVRFNQIVDGLKTGFTSGAGYCLTATSLKNDMRLIATVMGEDSPTTRTSEITAMLDYGYAKYKVDNIVKKGTIIDTVQLDKAKDEYVNIVALNNVSIVNQKSKNIGEISYNLNLDELKLPIKNGDVVGNLEVKEDDKVVDTIDVTVENDVEKISFWNLYMRYLKNILSGEIKI